MIGTTRGLPGNGLRAAPAGNGRSSGDNQQAATAVCGDRRGALGRAGADPGEVRSGRQRKRPAGAVR
jgi:hypothetical protein